MFKLKNETKISLREFIKKSDILLLLASLPLLPMLVAEFFIGVDTVTQAYFNVYYIALWIVFSIEFFIKFYFARKKIIYLKENWLDALVVLAPVFRSFKIFHVLRAPILLVSSEVVKLFKHLKLNFLYFFIVTIVVILVSADLVLFFERIDPTANIKTFEDAVWWGFVTFSTLGYGDMYPVTFGGRFIAVVLMTMGFALFSILAANAVSFFLRKKSEGHISAKVVNLSESVKEEKLNRILERLDKIEKKL